MINVRLTPAQFQAAFGNNEYVRNFAHDAQLAILTLIEDMQHNNDEHVDWTAIFQSANEVKHWADVPADVKDRASGLPYGGWIWFD